MTKKNQAVAVLEKPTGEVPADYLRTSMHGRKPLRLTKEQRGQLSELFKLKYRAQPGLVGVKPLLTVDAAMQAVTEEIREMPEYLAAVAAMDALAAAVEKRYKVTTAQLSINTGGALAISYESNEYASRTARDVVSSERRRRNNLVAHEVARQQAALTDEISKWTLERQSKLSAISVADNLDQVLAIVPEVRLDLPAQGDAHLNTGYTFGQLTAGTPLTLEAVLA
jgi:hypothetical protein